MSSNVLVMLPANVIGLFIFDRPDIELITRRHISNSITARNFVRNGKTWDHVNIIKKEAGIPAAVYTCT